MAVVYRCVGILTVNVVVFFRSPGIFHSQDSFPSTFRRASAVNTPTATTPEDVFHSRGQNVKGKESWEWKMPGLRKKTTSTVRISTQWSTSHLARNCSIKIMQTLCMCKWKWMVTFNRKHLCSSLFFDVNVVQVLSYNHTLNSQRFYRRSKEPSWLDGHSTSVREPTKIAPNTWISKVQNLKPSQPAFPPVQICQFRHRPSESLTRHLHHRLQENILLLRYTKY